jgi:pyruvate dehydrogenase E1 component beta subunit
MAQMTYRQALHDTLREELLRDENVFLMGEEIGNFEGSYKITAGLLKEFGPKRVVDTPICEMALWAWRLARRCWDCVPSWRL